VRLELLAELLVFLITPRVAERRELTGQPGGLLDQALIELLQLLCELSKLNGINNCLSHAAPSYQELGPKNFRECLETISVALLQPILWGLAVSLQQLRARSTSALHEESIKRGFRVADCAGYDFSRSRSLV
jgi:hypothetical protein